jgi:hypothetical protein
MNDIEKRKLALETYNLGLQMGETFAKDKHSGEYMVLAIMACISGLTNIKYSLMPIIQYDGEIFKSMRLQKGYTLRQTEDATGISNSYLSQLETGKIKKPSQNVVNKLLNWYNNGVSVEKSDYLANLQQ